MRQNLGRPGFSVLDPQAWVVRWFFRARKNGPL
jgi:hypothetical protein